MINNPGNVVAWQTDREGMVRVGIVRDGEESGVIYRENVDAAGRTLPLPQRRRENLKAALRQSGARLNRPRVVWPEIDGCVIRFAA